MKLNLSDHQWQRILSFLLSHPRVNVGRHCQCRAFLDALLWIMRTGAQWRALPSDRGRWNTVYRRFRAWAAKGVFSDMLALFADDADFEWLSIDSSTIRAHMSAAGAPHTAGGQHTQALGRSRGGFSTKIHVKVDALGNPLKLALTAGQTHQNRSIISGCYKIISQAYRWNEGIQSEYEHNENAGLATPRKRVPQATDLIITNKKQAPNACPF